MQGFPHFRECTFIGEYPLAELLSDEEKVTDNVIRFFFKDISDEEAEECKKSIIAVNKHLNRSIYDANLKCSLYSFFISCRQYMYRQRLKSCRLFSNQNSCALCSSDLVVKPLSCFCHISCQNDRILIFNLVIQRRRIGIERQKRMNKGREFLCSVRTQRNAQM